MITDKQFRDWHDDVFGFGYGSGEEFWLPALRELFADVIDEGGALDYRNAERAFGGLSAWLLINALCKADILEYGTSPRFSWLTEAGQLLRAYVWEHDEEALVAVACDWDDSTPICMRGWCNETMSEKNGLFGAIT